MITARRRLRDVERVALTFDDGPDPVTTPHLLATLEALDVTATFFVLGSAATRHPDLTRDIAARGHEIASHGFHHIDHRRFGAPGILRDVERARRVLESITGQSPRLFRPAYGSRCITTHVAAARHGQSVMLWSVDPYDWEPGITSHTVARRVLRSARGGDVILLHDTARHFRHPRQDAPALGAIAAVVQGLRARGLQVGRITVPPPRPGDRAAELVRATPRTQPSHL
jgi:peptidoglycan/xylan/chitin deacetylase (PgdA/CDA1 family)